ncbi:hypothetical protein BJ912DRAFT_935716 [Pholiota molesta]|nr:hypothetical protein BJ912DRAFT_935716 [Pholiota molesta]
MGSKPNLNLAWWILAEALYILALTVKPTRRRWRWLLFTAILSISTYALVFYRTDFRHLGLGERGICSRLPILVSFASANLLLCEPHEELRFVGQKPMNISDAPFTSRLWWALLVWANPRGINLAHEPTTHLPRGRSRRRAPGAMNRANPYFTKDIPVVVGLQRLWWLAGFEYMLVAIVLVVLGVSSPNDCPAYFGSPFEGIPFVEYGDDKKTAIICKLCVGFLLSGIIHYISEAVVMESLTEPLGCLGFFLLQILAILFEDSVIKAAHRVVSLPFWTAAGYRAGFTEELPQFSLVLGIWKGEWAPLNKPLVSDGGGSQIRSFCRQNGIWDTRKRPKRAARTAWACCKNLRRVRVGEQVEHFRVDDGDSSSSFTIKLSSGRGLKKHEVGEVWGQPYQTMACRIGEGSSAGGQKSIRY